MKFNFLSIFKEFIKNNYPLITLISIYIVSIILIAPWGNYAVNDDWQFLTHVRYFSEGNFIKNPLIDASFILQGFIALLWSKIFGVSFVSLRILTMIFTLLLFIGFIKILTYLKVNSKIKLILALCLLIEPFILTSSLSFMTEIYFLSFMVWSLYYYLKFTEEKKFNKNFIFAIILGSLSILIRQFGVVLFITYLISLAYLFGINKKTLKYYLLTLLLFVSTLIYNYNFPQYSGLYESKEDKVLSLFVNSKDIIEKLSYYVYYSVYLVFYTAPLLVVFLRKKDFLKLFFLSLPFATLIFTNDIFNLRNVFHLECLYCESNFYHEFSLFDNVPFKVLISFFLAYLFVNFILKVFSKIKFIKNFRSLKPNPNLFTIIILASGMLLVILTVDSFYDRYFTNFSIVFLILLGVVFKDKEVKLLLPTIIFAIFYLVILFLNIEFNNSSFYKWKQGLDLAQKTTLKSQILVSGSFSRYLNALEKKPEDLIRPVKFGVQKCYVIRHIKTENEFIEKILNSKPFNNRYIYNPTFSNVSNINPLPKSKVYLANTVSVDEYFSPMYNILGQRTFIISYCIDEVVQRYNLNTSDSLFLNE